MLACAIGDCNIDVFIRVVEATGKGNYFKVLYIHILMDLPNGDLVAAGSKKSCLLNGTEYESSIMNENQVVELSN